MSRHRLSVAVLAALACHGPAAAAPTPAISWGKAGVAFDEYRHDSVTCAVAGARRDMTGRDEFKEAMHGIKLQDSILDNNNGPSGEPVRDYALVQRRTMQRQVPALQRYLVGGVETCLRGKGYTPFVLTRDQAKALGRLHRGSPQRFHYLHALARDPAILSAQAVAPAPGRGEGQSDGR